MKTRTYESLDYRDEIAHVAARLIYNEGIRDYAFAKRKAVKQLGLPVRTMLPSNEAVDAALARFVAEYADEEEQPQRLAHLRQIALAVLTALPWPAYLVGSVADGTAGPLSEIEIDLFVESTKEVEITLLNEGRRFRVHTPKPASGKRPETELILEDEAVPVRLRIWPLAAERQRKKSERGLTATALAQLLASPSPVTR
ncbi:MAG: hypothetical protein N2557_03940 [Hydrogenophilus sp.]|nr:hypothetical protein [Hydrogenophilus sp.]